MSRDGQRHFRLTRLRPQDPSRSEFFLFGPRIAICAHGPSAKRDHGYTFSACPYPSPLDTSGHCSYLAGTM